MTVYWRHDHRWLRNVATFAPLVVWAVTIVRAVH